MPGELENQRITRLMPLDDVLAALATAVSAVSPRAVDLTGALDRVLAEDIVAVADQPAAARALRDGYAVCAEDIAEAGPYMAVPLDAPVRVDVGAVLPPKTDTVIPLDAVISRGGRLESVAPATIGDGVLPRGADLRAGDVIARAGWRLNDFNLAMLAMAGHKQVPVREPHVRLIKARAAADPVLDAAGDLLARALDACGCEVRRSADDLAEALVDPSTDAVIAIGGTGAGRNDASVRVLARHGRVAVHGIAISPGETAAFGMSDSRPVLLLPGRLDAAIAGWLSVGLPLVDRLSGSREAPEPVRIAALTRKVASPIGLVEIVPVRLTGGQAEPIASGYWSLAPLAASDGWILVPANSEGLPAGSEVVIRPWP